METVSKPVGSDVRSCRTKCTSSFFLFIRNCLIATPTVQRIVFLKLVGLKLSLHLFALAWMAIAGLMPAHATGNGLTVSTAFTALKDANNVTTDGWYWFNTNSSYAFRTFVKAGGDILVLRDFGNGTGALPQNQDMSLSTGRQIVPAAALAQLVSLDYVRMVANDPLNANAAVDATSNNATLLARISQNTSLSNGVADRTINSTWTGVGQSHLRAPAASCTSAAETLANKVFHPCGDTQSLVLWSRSSIQRASWNLGELSNGGSIEMWVKAYSPPLPTISVAKSADKTLNVAAGEVVTYTYAITNTSTVPLHDVTISDLHQGYGSFANPNIESASVTFDDPTAINDSTNSNTSNNVWDLLGPGDTITVLATYTVTQDDLDKLQ